MNGCTRLTGCSPKTTLFFTSGPQKESPGSSARWWQPRRRGRVAAIDSGREPQGPEARSAAKYPERWSSVLPSPESRRSRSRPSASAVCSPWRSSTPVGCRSHAERSSSTHGPASRPSTLSNPPASLSSRVIRSTGRGASKLRAEPIRPFGTRPHGLPSATRNRFSEVLRDLVGAVR